MIFIVTMILFLIPLPHIREGGELKPITGGHFLLTKSKADSWNDMARIATVESIAERRTLAIDHSKWGWFTGDKVLLRDHFYATKPPLLSAVGAASYMVLREAVKLATGKTLSYKHNEDVIYPWVTLTTTVLSFALLLVYFFRALYLVDLSRTARNWIFWALAIGSLYPAYSTVFNNHSVAGSWLFIGFYYVLRYRLGGLLRWWEAIFAGAALMFAGLNDFTGALPFVPMFFVLIVIRDFGEIGSGGAVNREKGFLAIWVSLAASIFLMMMLLIGTTGTAILLLGPSILAVIIAVYLLIRRKPVSFLLLLGMLLPAVAHLFLNSRITGNWLPTYIQSDVYINAAGYYGEVLRPEESGPFSAKRWIYIANALFGVRGIFIYTPVLLVGLWYAVKTVFVKGDRLRLDASAVVLATLAGLWYVLLFASPNFGGTSYGFRHAIAATPLLIFFCYPLFTEKFSVLMSGIFKNGLVWGAVIGLIGLPYPWGVFWYLPRTDCSVVENLQFIAFSVISYFR
jgi:hypothetical protein